MWNAIFEEIFSIRFIVNFQFGVQSHIFILILELSLFLFGIQSRCPFFVWRSSHIFISTSKSLFLFDVRAHTFILAFEATPLVRCSEPHYHLGVQNCILAVWCLESLFVFSLISRAIFHLAFGVTLSFWHSKLLIIFFVRCSEPYVHSDVRSHCSFSVWRIKPFFHLGVQIRIFSWAFRAVVYL